MKKFGGLGPINSLRGLRYFSEGFPGKDVNHAALGRY
jgi:hypothetical protein